MLQLILHGQCFENQLLYEYPKALSFANLFEYPFELNPDSSSAKLKSFSSTSPTNFLLLMSFLILINSSPVNLARLWRLLNSWSVKVLLRAGPGNGTGKVLLFYQFRLMNSNPLIFWGCINDFLLISCTIFVRFSQMLCNHCMVIIFLSAIHIKKDTRSVI